MLGNGTGWSSRATGVAPDPVAGVPALVGGTRLVVAPDSPANVGTNGFFVILFLEATDREVFDLQIEVLGSGERDVATGDEFTVMVTSPSDESLLTRSWAVVSVSEHFPNGPEWGGACRSTEVVASHVDGDM